MGIRIEMEYFNNIIDIPSAPLPDPEGPLDETGFLQAAGEGFMRGAVDIAGAATIAAGGVVGLMEGGLFNEGDSDRVFRFYDDVIKPARAFWTPDPESASVADNIVGGIAGIAPSLLLGPAAIPSLVAGATFTTAVDLVEQNVDPALATAVGILGGVSTGLMVKIPASGKTLAKTLGLALTNPLIGATQTGVQRKTLEVAGHPDIAKSFDPFDPEGRAIDLALGVIFGGMGRYAAARQRLPIELNDAVDTTAEVQHVTKSDIVRGKNRVVHDDALNDAYDSLVDGRKVDVAEKVQGVEFKAVEPDADAKAIRQAGKEWEQGLPEEASGVLPDVPRETIIEKYFAEEQARFEELEAESPRVPVDGEKGESFVEPPSEVRAGGIEDPFSQSVDSLIDATPDMTVHAGFDAEGQIKTESARQFIDDGKAELKKAVGREELFNLAAECLMRG